MRGSILMGILLGFLVLAGVASAAVNNITSCGVTISSPGVYELQNNIFDNSTSRCIQINSSDVTFDGQGYTLDGIDGPSQGVRVNGAATLTNVTVKNLILTDWRYGILYLSVDNGNITGNTVASSWYGIYLSASGSNALTNNFANSNVYDGISLASSSNSNTLSGNTANSNGRYGIVLASSVNNALTNNIANSNNQDGIALDPSSNSNTLTGNTANSNGLYGIALDRSSNNVLTNNGAAMNLGTGIVLWVSSDSNNLTGNTANWNTYYGIYLYNSSSNALTDNTANSNNRGIYIESSNSNTFTGNNASSNNYQGIFLSSSTGNTLSGNVAQENGWYDFYIWASSDIDCNNGISGMTISGGRSFLYYSSQTTLSNAVASQLVLCNADNSNVNNVIVMGSDVLDNNGILLMRTDSAQISNSNSSNNAYGIDIELSSGNTIQGTTVSGNGRDGIYVYNSSNTLIDNTANSNALRGIFLESSSGNTITNNNLNSNNRGIYLLSSSGNTLTGNTVSSSVYQGIYLDSSGSNTLTGNVMSLNAYNFWIDGSTVPDYVQTIDTTNTVDGKPMHYHVGTSNTVIDSSTGAGYVGVVNGVNVTVKDLTLTKNGAGVLFVNTLDSFIENVTVSNNYGGMYLAGSGVSTITGSTASSNAQYGIYLWNSPSVITGSIVNSNGDIGIDLYNSDGSTITNNIINSNVRRGINLWASSSNIITDNTANLNNRGINLASSSSFNVLTGNTVNSNTYYGIYLGSSTGNSLTGNIVNSNNDTGVYLYNSNSSTLANNAVSLNGLDGIYLESSNGNAITNNTANSNVRRGISLKSSSSNTITDNTANSNNRGINMVASSNFNSLTGNTANSNAYHGINLGSSTGNTIIGNTAQENSYYDVYVWTSTDAGCNNEISGMVVSGARSFLYYNSSVSLSNAVASELVLCNADYSNVNNVIVMGSNVLDNNGILLVRTDFTNVTNSNSSNNADGINIKSSNNNTITGNTASGNSDWGIYLYSSSDNIIYNNYLDSVNNAYDDGVNDWNTTKTPGTNIIGGTSIGGNYWSDYTGSDTDSDGIGDTLLPYNSSGNIVNAGDWLPLTFPPVQATSNITLQQGWNLISLPLIPENTSIDAVLASIAGNYNVVLAWKPVSGSIIRGWNTSTARRGPLSEMTVDYGYWIDMNVPDILELSGTVPTSTTINVATGWNLVGYPSDTTQSLTSVLSPINYNVVLAWKDGKWNSSTARRGPLTGMDAGYGYWIDATGSGSYVVRN